MWTYQVGEKKTVTLEPEMAYGQRRDEMIGKIPVDKLPEGCEAGAKLRMQNGMTAEVLSIEDGEATLDANHHLAGKTLVFDLEVVQIKASPQLKAAPPKHTHTPLNP